MGKDKPIDDVYTLLVEIGRSDGDGLPDGATGGAMMCFARGTDEAHAVRETATVLKTADVAPLNITSYGNLRERKREGHDISEEERTLMQRACDENAVIVYQMTPFFEEQDA